MCPALRPRPGISAAPAAACCTLAGGNARTLASSLHRERSPHTYRGSGGTGTPSPKVSKLCWAHNPGRRRGAPFDFSFAAQAVVSPSCVRQLLLAECGHQIRDAAWLGLVGSGSCSWTSAPDVPARPRMQVSPRGRRSSRNSSIAGRGGLLARIRFSCKHGRETAVRRGPAGVVFRLVLRVVDAAVSIAAADVPAKDDQREPRDVVPGSCHAERSTSALTDVRSLRPNGTRSARVPAYRRSLPRGLALPLIEVEEASVDGGCVRQSPGWAGLAMTARAMVVWDATAARVDTAPGLWS